MAKAFDLAKTKVNMSRIFEKASVPEVFSAKVFNVKDDDTVDINVVWKQNDFTINKSKKFSISYKFDAEIGKLEQSGFPVEINSEIILDATSPSKSQHAFIKKIKKPEEKFDYILEIWSDTKCSNTINLSSIGIHGDVHSDITFSSLSWNENEQCLMYLAEKSMKDHKNDVKDVDDKYVYEESWGELLYKISTPVICVLDISKEKIHLIESPYFDYVSPSQPQFGPGSNTIVFCGIKKLPYRLGKIYCSNRSSYIYFLKLSDEFKVDKIVNITESFPGISCNWCPRINKSCSKILYLHRSLEEDGSPHQSETKLFCYDITKQITLNVLPINKTAHYTSMLPFSVWFEDDVHFAVQDLNTFLVINADTHQIVSSYESCTEFILAESSLAIFSTSMLDSKEVELVIYDHKNKRFVTMNKIACHSDIEKQKISLDCTKNVVSWGLIPYQSTLRERSVPLIVWAHGGPHSVFTDLYNPFATAFCKMGYAVLLVNYSGSVGFGCETTAALPGKIGEKDVAEVQSVAKAFLEKNEKILDAKNVFYFGGSHGGFIGAHLMAQFPDFYRAAVLRNPVIEIASMSMVTDIPDWCYFECGLPYSQGKLPNAKDYSVMLSKSPIIKLESIKAPILICLGGKDLRVPPSQGKAFYRLLKGNDKITKLLFFPNASHPLKDVEIVQDFFVYSCKWYEEYKER